MEREKRVLFVETEMWPSLHEIMTNDRVELGRTFIETVIVSMVSVGDVLMLYRRR
jgi:hypothetical protein